MFSLISVMKLWLKDSKKQNGWKRVNRRERHTLNLISILQQDCLGFGVCCGPLACVSHFNERIFFSKDESCYSPFTFPIQCLISG